MKILKNLFMVLLSILVITSCNNEIDVVKDSKEKKEYDITSLLKMKNEEIKTFHPELMKKISNSNINEIDMWKEISNVDVNDKEKIDEFLQNKELDENIKSFVVDFCTYKDNKNTRMIYTEEQQKCLDEYALKMSQIRRRFIIDVFFKTPLGAFWSAKLDMQEAYEDRELCMQNAK